LSARTERHDARHLPIDTFRVSVVGTTATTDALDRVTVGTASDNDLVLEDRGVSRYHLELERTPQGIEVRDLGSTNGTRIGAVTVMQARVPPGAELLVGSTTLRVDAGGRTDAPMHPEPKLGGIVGSAPAMRRLMAKVERAAQSDVAVLLTGESGTGKERIARALHELGPRRGGPFVTVDCGALAPTLVASELFGHEPGAFTGAQKRHLGAFERAEGGTIFLDEIGELPESLQPNLLGVLERRRFRRLGGQSEVAVDVRVVSATHRDVRRAVNQGRFRLDLYYRLAVVTLQVPPLRERVEDVPVLAAHFLRELGWEHPEKLLRGPTLRALERHHWPGNVRELRNFVEATVAMGEAPPLQDVAPAGDEDPIASLLGLTYKEARATLLGRFEARYLEALLERAEGNVSKASRMAKMDRGHLTDLLRRHGLK